MNTFDNTPEILDVTLRDGSYLIEFQFTARDTAVIGSALESAGIRWIEVGHGLGLNASATGKGTAAATDEEYLEAAAESLKLARWGMFFIPGIGRADDLRLASRYKMPFVRIGTNITEIDQAEPFIKQAKDLGMLVSFNGMKSYAVSPEEWGQKAAAVGEWGADIACLVDSAGCMFPDQISKYLRAARAESPVALGFHGHDNLALSMANTLRAIDEGAALVDSSLQGMGRSAGNAITEILVAIMKKRGLLPNIDMNAVMDIGFGLVRPLLGHRGVDPMGVTGGYAGFHSSFTPKVVKYAEKHGVDVRDLILSLCSKDQISAPDALLEALGLELASAKGSSPISISSPRTKEPRRLGGGQAIKDLLVELRREAVKAAKISVLNAVIADGPLEEMAVSGNVQQTIGHVVGSVRFATNEQLETILQCVEGKADVMFLDVDRKPAGPPDIVATAARVLVKTTLLTYLDSRLWVDAVETQTVRLLKEDLEDVPVVIVGSHNKSRLLGTVLNQRGASVTLLSSETATLPESNLNGIHEFRADTRQAGDKLEEARMVIVWPDGDPWFGEREARRLAPGAYVLDSGMGGFPKGAVDEIAKRNAVLVRLDMWPALAGALHAAHESYRISVKSMGRTTIAGVPVVAGGAMGHKGDVIVDHVHDPSRVIGIADGQGAILFQYTDEEADRVHRVAREISSRMVAPRFNALQ
jgi:4-hydroxy-2-oxovalerate aldolase